MLVRDLQNEAIFLLDWSNVTVFRSLLSTINVYQTPIDNSIYLLKFYLAKIHDYQYYYQIFNKELILPFIFQLYIYNLITKRVK